MKKYILSVLALVLSASMFALEGETAAYQLDVYVDAENVDNIVLSEAPFYTDGFDNLYDGLKAPMGNDTLIYSVLDNQKLSVVARPSLVGTLISFQANAATQYKLAVEGWVVKENLSLLDHLTNLQYPLVDGAEISFTQETRTKAKDRFEIIDNSFVPDEGDLEVCHINGNLEIHNNPYTTNIVVKDKAGEAVINMIPQPTKPNPQLISLEALEAGHYTVEFNEGAKVFVIAVKPEVIPAP